MQTLATEVASSARSKEMKIAIMRSVTTAVAAIGLMVGSASVRAADNDIVDTAISAGQFKTLAAALGAADLVGTLKGTGPFTVFAPTDEAFAKLPAGAVEDLLKPENKEKLVGILTYHVVPGRAMAKDVAGMTSAKTVNGKEVHLAARDGKVTVDKATVTK